MLVHKAQLSAARRERGSSMKRRVALFASLVVLSVMVFFLFLSAKMPVESNQSAMTAGELTGTAAESDNAFRVYSYNTLKQSFETLEEAVAFAESMKHASVRKQGESRIYWDNYGAFVVRQNGRYISDFDDFNEAVRYAKGFLGTQIFFQQYGTPVWENKKLPARSELIDAPLIAQMPELPRGCEVTSLAMLLRVAGADADKMKLAKEIKKDPTPYRKKNGVVYYGNPYDGYIGDMYTFDKPGYGVYHGPIKELAENYLPGRIIDMTGSELKDILYALDRGAPVWIISNTRFKRLPDSMFQTWQTPSGPVKITYREHSVLITGYDEKYIYFNDPLANIKNRKIAIDSFKEAYDQMGKQAITYVEG